MCIASAFKCTLNSTYYLKLKCRQIIKTAKHNFNQKKAINSSVWHLLGQTQICKHLQI